MNLKDPQTLKDFFTDDEWAELVQQEPLLPFMASASWQDPANFSTVSTTVSDVSDFLSTQEGDEKPGDKGWRDLQKQCWIKYKTFGPLNSAVDSKADYVAQAGFSVYSDYLEVNEFLKDLFYHYRNKLYARVTGWVIRMLAEGELFKLLIVGEDGSMTVRSLDPTNIGSGNLDHGLLVDPDDVTQTVFYNYKTRKKNELIPDARFILEPEYMIEAVKRLGTAFDPKKVSELTKGKGKGSYSKIGGYRRFILHWKNLTGIYEYKRDTASLVTTLEWINLYTNALKWELDHKKALCAYTIESIFGDSVAGKVAWTLWQKMSPEAKEATNLTKPLTPGSRVFSMPGMTLKIHAPQLQALTGSNQDVLNLAGAGARTPQDLWQGQSAGATYASIRSSRPPLVAEIENLQSKLEHFLRYEFLRICFAAKLAMGGSVLVAGGKKLKLEETYKVPWVQYEVQQEETEEPKATIAMIDVELCEVVKFTFPPIRLDPNPEQQANAYLGSKHAGLQSVGLSAETTMKKLGIDDMSREKKKQYLENATYGKPVTGSEHEQTLEKSFTKSGKDGRVTPDNGKTQPQE
jgi:hypothetical protein